MSPDCKNNCCEHEPEEGFVHFELDIDSENKVIGMQHKCKKCGEFYK